jgi:hypothetical protein
MLGDVPLPFDETPLDAFDPSLDRAAQVFEPAVYRLRCLRPAADSETARARRAAFDRPRAATLQRSRTMPAAASRPATNQMKTHEGTWP